MAEGIFINFLYSLKDPHISTQQIQSVVVICNNCGYMRQFAAKAILPDWEELKKNPTKK